MKLSLKCILHRKSKFSESSLGFPVWNEKLETENGLLGRFKFVSGELKQGRQERQQDNKQNN